MQIRRQLATAALGVSVALVGTGAALAAGSSAVSSADPTGDYQLIDGHRGPRSASIDIESMRWARSGGALRVSVVIRRLRPDNLNQYAVFRAVDPATHLRFLIQACTVTPVAHVARRSWANLVACPHATGRIHQHADGTGSIVATVPLGCLGRPAKLKQLSVHTLARSFHMDTDYSADHAGTQKVLRVR
jgi:hypothetical protein